MSDEIAVPNFRGMTFCDLCGSPLQPEDYLFGTCGRCTEHLALPDGQDHKGRACHEKGRKKILRSVGPRGR